MLKKPEEMASIWLNYEIFYFNYSYLHSAKVQLDWSLEVIFMQGIDAFKMKNHLKHENYSGPSSATKNNHSKFDIYFHHRITLHKIELLCSIGIIIISNIIITIIIFNIKDSTKFWNFNITNFFFIVIIVVLASNISFSESPLSSSSYQ